MRDDAKRSNAQLQMEGLSSDTDKDDARWHLNGTGEGRLFRCSLFLQQLKDPPGYLAWYYAGCFGALFSDDAKTVS